MAVSNAENASAFDGPLLLLLLSSSSSVSSSTWSGFLARKSQSRHHLAFEIHSLSHRMPSRKKFPEFEAPENKRSDKRRSTVQHAGELGDEGRSSDAVFAI
ncbi:hypothetical protein TNCV_4892911 [Trichonephila clavipes]|nr:hypothetical protein TNCV_4892911 [Trichonephila clavipes]